MGGVVERDAQLWIEHGGVLRVDGRGQRRDGAEAAGTERLGGVARGVDHGLAVRDNTAVEALWVEAARRERRLVEAGVVVKLMLVVEAEDVQAEVAFRAGAPDPAGGGPGSGVAAAGVAHSAIHPVRHRQNDVVRGDDATAAVTGQEAHRGIRILLPRAS